MESHCHIHTNTHTDTQSFVSSSEIQKVFFFFQLIQWYNLILTQTNLKLLTAFIYPPWISWKHFTKQYSDARTLYWDILYHLPLLFNINCIPPLESRLAVGRISGIVLRRALGSPGNLLLHSPFSHHKTYHRSKIIELALPTQSPDSPPCPSFLTSSQPWVILCGDGQVLFWTHHSTNSTPLDIKLASASCCDYLIGNVLEWMAAFRQLGFISWLHLFSAFG